MDKNEVIVTITGPGKAGNFFIMRQMTLLYKIKIQGKLHKFVQ